MSNTPEQKNVIDAVITWVDGNNESHREKRLLALETENNEKTNELITGRDNTRFMDNGELKFCISSIRKFAPWIRKIHLLTDNQIPDFLTPQVQSELGVTITDHKEIFETYEWALPTFNTRTIESALWRIPCLAPYFIYFNDDFVLTSAVSPKDFFSEGKVVLRGRWSPIKKYGTARIKLNNIVSYVAKHLLGITRSMHLLLQIRSAMLAGFDNQYFRAPHVPHPVRRATLKQFFDENPALFENNIKFQFRSTDQFSAIFLANHLEIKNHHAVLENSRDSIMINGEMDFSFFIQRKLKKVREGSIKFTCLQGFENFSEKQRGKIEASIRSLLDLS